MLLSVLTGKGLTFLISVALATPGGAVERHCVPVKGAGPLPNQS